jgi:carboxyl-terminal processing protease
MWLLTLTGCGIPTICVEDSDAHDVIDDFWGTLDREYAVFDVRLEGSWEDVGREACAQVTADPSDDGVFDALLGMARALDDGHIQLESDTREADGWASPWPHYAAAAGLVDNAEDRYIDSTMRRRTEGAFAWGRIGEVGYLAVTRMDELDEDDREFDAIELSRDSMEAALEDLTGTVGLIVDVRANEGGWDRVSLEIARWFAGPETVAWSKARRNGPDHGDFGRFMDQTVAASGPGAYTGPVVLLTSGGTFSAAETFVLAMGVRDDVTVLGERTSGHFSDLDEAELPNGWTFTWSGDRYRAADGEIYEARGAPVEVEVPFDFAALEEGVDVQLEAALARF